MVAGIKTRHPDDLQRAVLAVRQRHNYYNELKFGRIQPPSYAVITDVIDVLENSDAHLIATVVDASYNPFKGQETWHAHGRIVSQLIVGNLNRHETGVVFMDGVSTPEGVSLGTMVRRSINAKLGAQTIVTAVSLDSRCNDLLQLADLVAGAIRHGRAASTPTGSATGELKAKVASRVALAFGTTDLSDQRHRRVNILTMSGSRRRRDHLRVVSKRSAS